MGKRSKPIRQEACKEWEKDKTMPIPEIIVYLNKNFVGDGFRTNCDVDYVGDEFNDDIISAVVVSGVWKFYQHAGYNNGHRGFSFELAPGYYSDLSVRIGSEEIGISSFKCVTLTNI